MMKSYTLNNWDGSVRGSEETTPQTVSNSLTSAHTLTSNIQTSDSSNNINFGNTVGITLYGGEHGKEGTGMDNGLHDASTEGASMFDSWVNGEMYSAEDVPSASKEPSGMNQDQNRTAPWIAESESSFKNASGEIGNGIIAEGHAYSQSQLLPRNTAEIIGGATKPLEASSPMPDASSSINFEQVSYSAAKGFNSDILTFSTTIQVSSKDNFNPPNGFQPIQKGLIFKPDLSSPLHTVRPSDLSRRSPISSNSQLNFLNIPAHSPMSSIYLNSNLPSPKSENHSFDATSVHTADGEGTDEDDEVIILENIPSHTPQKPSQEMNMYDSLFTPPPSDGYIAVEDLFTPPPAKRKRPRPPPKVLMSHVSLPPPRHQQINNARISRPPPKKKLRDIAQVQVHNDLAGAMQASWDNNDSLGTLPMNNKTIKVNRAKAKDSKYQGNKASVAGPSQHSSQSTSISKSVQQHLKRRRNNFEDREESASISSKKPRITIDLTLSDNGNETKKRKREEVAMPKPKQLPPTAPIPSTTKNHTKAPPLAPARSKYNAERDCVRLFLGTIKETPPDLVFHNTRFVRRRAHGVTTPLEDTQKSLESSTWLSSDKTRIRKSVDINWPLLRSRSKTTTSTTDSEGEISLGGRLFWAEESEGDDEDGKGDEDEGDVVIVTRGPLRQDVAPRPSVPPAPPPPRIDLAAQFKKRQRKPPAPPQRRASTTITVSSSPSVASIRPTSTQTPTATPSVSARSDVAGLAPTPSAKALGKRKAVSLTTSTSPTFVYYPNYPLVNQPQRSNNYPTPYNQTLPAQSSLSASSSSTAVAHPQTPTFYPPIQYYPNPNLNSGTTSFVHPYPPQPVPSISPGGFGAQTSDQTASWVTQATIEQPQEPTYATVDPTWLGGQLSAIAYQEPEPDLELLHNEFLQIPSSPPQQEPDPELPADSHSGTFQTPHPPAQPSTQLEFQPDSQNDFLQNPPSPSLLNDQDVVYEPTTHIYQTLPETQGPRLTDDSRPPSAPVFKLPPRRGRRRSIAPEYAPSAPPSDDDDDYSESEVVVANKRKPRPVASTSQVSLQKEPAPTSNPLFTTLTRADQVQYPLAETAEYCHQCRRKTFIFKMTCRCNTLICCRCVALRYPDKKFDVKVKQKTCPRCDNYCNCTHCCQKRNVPYVSSTRTYQVGPVTKTKTETETETEMKTKMKPSLRLVLPGDVPPPNTQYWGAIYSLDGQKMGATFAAPAGDGLSSVVLAGSISQPRPAQPKRTFVGGLQRSWGFGRNRLIKDLNPVPQKKSKSRKSDYRVTRFFVGSPSFVRYRLRLPTPNPSDEEDLLEGLSPLTSLGSDSEDDRDGATIGISIPAPPEEAFTPGCLEERDVARAIAAAFEALGILPVFELPYYC